MSVKIKSARLGIAETNAYLVGDTETGDAVLIDPVDQADALKAMADEEGWTIKLILATHAHFDHVLASQALKDLTGAPFWISDEASEWLPGVPQTGVLFTGERFPKPAEPDRLLTNEPETFSVGTMTFETLYTPGHAPGHLAFYLPAEGIVFSGDSLFAGTIGRTDLIGGDQDLLLDKIREHLLTLPDDTRVFSGHGKPTTIGIERATNPFLT